uniref:Uncharacterized protein n=1 Tax=Picea glauca TaxID=3330 RepID=A0A101LWW9_PICGL|nr:hypothetical protein ABT39_MTgene6294 [Picea glauca]
MDFIHTILGIPHLLSHLLFCCCGLLFCCCGLVILHFPVGLLLVGVFRGISQGLTFYVLLLHLIFQLYILGLQLL